MVIIRDEARIARLGRRGKRASIVGLLILISGLVIAFLPNVGNLPNPFLIQTGTLVTGWLLSQYGIYLSHRYLRSPRPDQVLDEVLRPAARGGRLYHFVLPAPHVLLSKAGLIVFVLKYQTGKISAEGNKWRQRGMGFLSFRRLFGQEGLGNPSKEAEHYIGALAGFIRKHAPEVEEVPIGALIVFTSKNIAALETKNADFPAMHYTKVKGFLRQKGLGEAIPQRDMVALRRAFDAASGDRVPSAGEQANEA
jgi:hypothetical protein